MTATFFCFAFLKVYFSAHRARKGSYWVVWLMYPWLLSFRDCFRWSTPTHTSYILLPISVEGPVAVPCGEISQINGAVHLVHPAATCLCSSHPFCLSSWSLSGPRQCLIYITHRGTLQPDLAHLMNWHHHWRCGYPEALDLLVWLCPKSLVTVTPSFTFYRQLQKLLWIIWSPCLLPVIVLNQLFSLLLTRTADLTSS